MTTFSQRHSLASVDRGQMQAVCSACGPVRIRSNGKGEGVRCAVAADSYTKAHRVTERQHYRQYAREYAKTWTSPNPLAPRKKFIQRLKKYGITFEQFSELLINQTGHCESCGDPMENPQVDHDHSCCSGMPACGLCVRALLCLPCNWGIGVFRDEPERLQLAMRYLMRFKP